MRLSAASSYTAASCDPSCLRNPSILNWCLSAYSMPSTVGLPRAPCIGIGRRFGAAAVPEVWLRGLEELPAGFSDGFEALGDD
ncbi:hypothetical protein, partial [Infirmifilum sp.]|uniref:hypothetical protein n=1 Tax=Infirmifilum sp. TaxID=2856575 RepID=UPI003D0EEF3A